MRPLIIISLFLFGQFTTFGQLPEITGNYSKTDSAQNPLIDSFSKHYDCIIAFTEQGYWFADRKNYKILACRGNVWSSWIYSTYIISSKKIKENRITFDTIKNGSFIKQKSKIQAKHVNKLLSDLSNSNFWHLNQDSLNNAIIQTFVENNDTLIKKVDISDGINYRFDVFRKTIWRVVQSYEPDYFIGKSLNMEERRKFVNSRETFLKWWGTYCY